MKTRNAYYFLISGFLLAVGFNLPHMVEAYRIASPLEMPVWLLWGTMIVIELGILILALNKNLGAALVFAWLIFLLNLYVYWSPLEFVNRLSFWVSLVPGLLFAAVPAFFIYYFSEKIAELVEYRNEIQAYKDRAEKAERENKRLEHNKDDADGLRNDLTETRKKLITVRKELEEARNIKPILADFGTALKESMPKTKDNLRNSAKSRRQKISANGISGEEKRKLQIEIAAMELAREIK